MSENGFSCHASWLTWTSHETISALGPPSWIDEECEDSSFTRLSASSRIRGRSMVTGRQQVAHRYKIDVSCYGLNTVNMAHGLQAALSANEQTHNGTLQWCKPGSRLSSPCRDPDLETVPGRTSRILTVLNHAESHLYISFLALRNSGKADIPVW